MDFDWSICYDVLAMEKRLSSDQRCRVAEKIMEWGNLVFVGLVIGQFVPGPLSDSNLLLVGVASIAGAYWLALRLMRGGGKQCCRFLQLVL